MLEVDVEAFRLWLLSQDDEVGEGTCPWGCPLARWMKAVTGQPYEVGACMYGRGDGRWEQLPAWADQFVSLVDSEVGDGVVSKELALILLDCVQAA